MIDETSKNTYNRESLNTGAITLKKDRQAPPIQDRTELQTYLFELGSEEKIYSITFNGRISDTETQKILEVMHRQPYRNCFEAVWAYLEQNKLEYSHFKTELSPSIHGDIMTRADIILKSLSKDAVDRQIGRADNYYAVMDYQKINAFCCEGCYYAISRSLNGESNSCHIIGQTFTCDTRDENQSGYFAIRIGDCQQLHDLDIKTDNLIFPAFGCMDMLGVLLNINAIHTAKEAEKIAVK